MFDTVASSLSLPQRIVDDAVEIFEKYHGTRSSIYGLKAASLYLACRLDSIPRTLKDFADAANVDRKMLSSMYRKIVLDGDYKVPLQDPNIFMNRVSSKLGLRPRTVKWMQDMMNKNSGEICSLVGSDPMVRVGAITYIATVVNGDSQTQKQIAEACGVSDTTIRGAYMKLHKAGYGC